MNTLFQEINKADWMKDSEATSCLNCSSHFTPILRRHHCRYCGIIFCKKCIHSKAIINSRKLKKVCVKCLNRLKKQEENLATKTKQHPSMEFHNSNTLRSESQSSGDLIQEHNRVYHQTENPQQEVLGLLAELSEVEELFEESIYKYLWQRTRELLEAQNIDEEWCETVVKLVNSCVKSVCCSGKFLGDFMDLNYYVKIQPIICNDLSFTNFITGIAFLGKLASNKMGKLLQSPKILIIKNFSILLSSTSLISMDKLIDQEVKLESLLLKKILSLGPNVLICGNTLTQSFITSLSINNITAILKVKPKTLKLLSRATSAKILKNCESLNYEKNFLGSCGCFYQETRGDRTLLHFTGLKDRTSAGTIFISGPNSFELTSIKKILRSLIVEYRNILIEKCFVNLFKIKNPEIFFLNNYDKSIMIKQLVTCNNSLCICPYDFAADFYSVKDQSLGEYLIVNARRFEDLCENCKSPWGAHCCYYMREDGRIKVKLVQTKSLNFGANIIFNRECKICGKFEKHKTQLTNAQWEYSFYKFINNFFTKSETISVSIDCKHNFFRWSKFNFYVEGAKIEIEWEDNPCYTVLNMTDLPDNSSYYQSLISNLVSDLISTGDKIIGNLLSCAEEIMINIDSYLNDEYKNQRQFLNTIKSDTTEIMSQISSELAGISSISYENFNNILEVETVKREFFLSICQFKRKIYYLKTLLGKVKKKERMSVVDSVVQESFHNSKVFRLSIESEQYRNKSVLSSETSFKPDESLNQKEFQDLRRGNFTLMQGKNGLVVPVDELDTMSILAYAFNTNEYFDEILNTLSEKTESHSYESELLNCNEKHFQVQFSTYPSEDSNKSEEFQSLYGDHITFTVHILYPKQFQIIRNTFIKNHLDFICSLYMSENKKEQLGKSKATFTKTHDDQFIIKILDEKDFSMFKDMAPNYFRHFCNSEYHSMPSKLVKTLGCFRISVKNHSQNRNRVEWALLFENLSAIMPGEFEVYDLKGSFNDRRYVNKKEKRTKMDKNFLEDFEGMPLTISLEAKTLLDMSIWNDTLLLSKKNIVDYSLLLMVSNKQRVLTFGIIDYVAKYTLEKAVERKIKKVVSNDDPTIAKPLKYKNRFRECLSKRFFVELIQ